jgi:uncharacterized protein (DUF342 family)
MVNRHGAVVSIGRLGDRGSYLFVYTVLLFLLFSIVFYDKADEVNRLVVDLNTVRQELATLEHTMVDIIQDEVSRRASELKTRLAEQNKKREQTIARSYTLLQRAEAELQEAQLEADERLQAAQIKEKQVSEDRAQVNN